jgi:hypothetical protein
MTEVRNPGSPEPPSSTVQPSHPGVLRTLPRSDRQDRLPSVGSHIPRVGYEWCVDCQPHTSSMEAEHWQRLAWCGSQGLTKWGRGGLEPVGFALRKIIMNVHGHVRSHNSGKRIMRCSFLARRLVVCLERVTTATIKQFIRPSRPLFYMKERATRDNLALVAYDCSDDHL